MGRFTPRSGYAMGRALSQAANSNISRRARLLAAARLALRLGKTLHPALRLLDLLWRLWELQQSLNAETRVGRWPSGMYREHVCPLLGGMDHFPSNRSAWALAPACLANQALTPNDLWAPLSAGEQLGFVLSGAVHSPPAPAPNIRFNHMEYWKPTPGSVVLPDVVQGVPLPPEVPAWIAPPKPFDFEPAQPVAPPLVVVRARQKARPVGDPIEDSVGGDELQVGRIDVIGDMPLIPLLRPYPVGPFAPGMPGGRPPRLPRRKLEDESEHEDLDEKKDQPDEWQRWPRDPGDEDRDPERMARRAGKKPEPGQWNVGRGGIRVEPSGHVRQKPKERTKERKVMVSASQIGFGRFLGKFTEALDVVNAFYEALPEAMRKRERMRRHGKDPRMSVKLQMIYEHYDKLDARDVAVNLIKNFAEDMFYGQLGRRVQAELNRAGYQRPVGIQTGNTLGKTPEGFKGGGNPLNQLLDWVGESYLAASDRNPDFLRRRLGDDSSPFTIGRP